jgi:hypothetical protein
MESELMLSHSNAHVQKVRLCRCTPNLRDDAGVEEMAWSLGYHKFKNKRSHRSCRLPRNHRDLGPGTWESDHSRDNRCRGGYKSATIPQHTCTVKDVLPWSDILVERWRVSLTANMRVVTLPKSANATWWIPQNSGQRRNPS